MNLDKLRARREKLDEQIRKSKERELAKKERALLILARKHGLLNLELPALEAALLKVTGETESRIRCGTVSPDAELVRTPDGETVPETAGSVSVPDVDPSKKKWGWK